MASATTPTEGSGEGPHRRDRAVIAAQACQTCRSRKSKCDERRPKCGLCRRLGVECEYREPLPTKKDKTMVHILDTLSRLENKFDNFAYLGGRSADDAGSPRQGTPAGHMRTSTMGSTAANGGPNKSSASRTFDNLTLSHKIMLWPTIYMFLVNSGIPAASDLQYLMQEGTPWLIRRDILARTLDMPADVGLPSYPVNAGAREQGFHPNVCFPTLQVQQIQQTSDAYFNTFNMLYPLLNRETFMNDIVARLLREGFGYGDTGSVLALLVFALGQVAVEGVFERPISIVNGQPSGFRGGSLQHPPGLGMFNEARRRMGFVSTQSSVENVQIHLLVALYYEANARHLDFWRATSAAAMSCQVLITWTSPDWTSRDSDLLKRAFWVCILSEDFYHLDLDLPRTGIARLEDEIPLPSFSDAQQPPHGQEDFLEDRTHWQYHFLAMIALRKHVMRINATIQEASNENPETAEDYRAPPIHVIREMARQLEQWRQLLPRALQWEDSDKFEFPNPDPTNRRPNETLFAVDQGHVPIGHKHSLDILTAQLRTRFYYARFVLYRPFVFKALHFPDLMNADDASCCALAIRSACLWPMSMAPPKNKKRLVPHLFAWTQSFIGILLILRMTTESPCLKQICGEQVNTEEVETTMALMLDWVRDVKQLDGIAAWSWRILEPLFQNRRV